jgi:hypothetical protein
MAAELHAHFARGGSIAEAIRLVELIELRGKRKRSSRNDCSPRGTRLPTDWRPSPTDIEFARAKGMHPARIGTEGERFRNYWTAKCGAAATKLDWPATWRNWIIRALETSYGNRNTGTVSRTGRAAAGQNAVIAGLGNLAASRRAAREPARSDDGEMARSADAPLRLTAVSDLDR